jgi:hypothetical protein
MYNITYFYGVLLHFIDKLVISLLLSEGNICKPGCAVCGFSHVCYVIGCGPAPSYFQLHKIVHSAAAQTAGKSLCLSLFA